MQVNSSTAAATAPQKITTKLHKKVTVFRSSISLLKLDNIQRGANKVFKCVLLSHDNTYTQTFSYISTMCRSFLFTNSTSTFSSRKIPFNSLTLSWKMLEKNHTFEIEITNRQHFRSPTKRWQSQRFELISKYGSKTVGCFLIDKWAWVPWIHNAKNMRKLDLGNERRHTECTQLIHQSISFRSAVTFLAKTSHVPMILYRHSLDKHLQFDLRYWSVVANISSVKSLQSARERRRFTVTFSDVAKGILG